MLTVVTQAATYDLTVLATVKERLGITDASNDTLLGHLISAASDKASSYCNRVFAQEQVSQTFRLPRIRGAGGELPQSLELTRFPIISIDAATDGTTVLTSADYEVDDETGLLYRLDGNDCRWHWFGPKIVVLYTAGFALLDDLPYPIEEAVIELIKTAFAGRKRDPMIKSEMITDIGSTDFWVGGVPGANTSGMPDYITGMLDPFRNIPV